MNEHREQIASAAWAFGVCAGATMAAALLLAVLVVDLGAVKARGFARRGT
jgi:hypothetical protein